MKWELWEPPDPPPDEPSNDYFFSEHEVQMRSFAQEDGMTCTWTVEADTYEAAMQKLYDFRGWGTYRPIEGEDTP